MLLIRFFLILCCVLTGYALASARGQTHIGQRVVLCSGQAVVLSYGADGKPEESPYYCPDMAAVAFASVLVDGPVLPLQQRQYRAVIYPIQVSHAMAATRVQAHARDPPVLIAL